MLPPQPLPPCAIQSSGAAQSASRDIVRPAATVCLMLVLWGGCRSGTSLAKATRPPRDPAVAELTRPAAETGRSGRKAEIASRDTSQSLAANDERPADKPRRLVPAWLQFGPEQRSVPLPTTPVADDLTAETSAVSTGPVEQFQ